MGGVAFREREIMGLSLWAYAALLCVAANDFTLKASCDPSTKTVSGFEGWFLKIGQTTFPCLSFSPSLCSGLKNQKDSRFNATVITACCSCPSSTPSRSATTSPSPSSSASESQSFSQSLSASASDSQSTSQSDSHSSSHTHSSSVSLSTSRTTSVSPTVTPSSDPVFFYPKPNIETRISADGSSGWTNGQFRDLTPVFGSSLTVTDLSGLPFSAVQNTVPIIITSISANGGKGDAMIAYLSGGPKIEKVALTLSDLGISGVSPGDAFGAACIVIPDVDGNGVDDIFATARFDDNPASATGAAYLILLEQAGNTVRAKKTVKLGVPIPNPPANYITLESHGVDTTWHLTGNALATVDIDNDGVVEVLMGAPGCKTCYFGDFNDEIDFAGVVYVLTFERTDVTANLIRHELAIKPSDLGFDIPAGSEFGYSIAVVDDMDFDGKPELVVGAPAMNGQRGAIFIVSWTIVSGAVHIRWARKLFPSNLLVDSRFGSCVTQGFDLNHDGVPELVVGASFHPAFSSKTHLNPGEVHVISLNNSKAQLCDYYSGHGVQLGVCTHLKQSSTVDVTTLGVSFPEFDIQFSQVIKSTEAQDMFGEALAFIGDLDGNGVPELMVGAPRANSLAGKLFSAALAQAGPSQTSTPSKTPSQTSTQTRTPTNSASHTHSATPSVSELTCTDCLKIIDYRTRGLFLLFLLILLISCCCRSNSWLRYLKKKQEDHPTLDSHTTKVDVFSTPNTAQKITSQEFLSLDVGHAQ